MSAVSFKCLLKDYTSVYVVACLAQITHTLHNHQVVEVLECCHVFGNH